VTPTLVIKDLPEPGMSVQIEADSAGYIPEGYHLAAILIQLLKRHAKFRALN